MNAMTYIAIGLALAFFGAVIRIVQLTAGKGSGETALKTKLDIQAQAIRESEEKNRALVGEVQTLREDAIRLQAEKNYLQQKISEHKEGLEKIEEKFKSQFENLANKILDEKSSKFKIQSQETLGALLNPLKDEIEKFQKKVDESFGSQAKEQFSLKEQIKNIIEVNEKMTLQTEGLANALKGESKVQGDWGEVILEKILEDSGLRKEIDYIIQGRNLDLRNADTDQIQKPDVIVNLPENKHLIIDSKVSLTHYERFFSESDEALRPAHLKQFIASIRAHVAGLEQRRYQDTDKLGTPDFVLMFMPIEGAYMLALQQDRDLQNLAWNKNVILIGPTNLFATLRTIASLWRLVSQNQNALEIARQGGSLYDKIEGFVGDMTALGRQLKSAEKTYGEAMNKLTVGQGNILRRTEKLKELGAKTSKMLPRALLGSDMDDDTETTEPLDQKTGT